VQSFGFAEEILDWDVIYPPLAMVVVVPVEVNSKQAFP
jgi:hypothetical protein